MSELEEHESKFARWLEGVPFDDAPRGAHRAALRERAQACFDSAAAAPSRLAWKSTFNYGRRLMRRPTIRYGTLAAACAAVAVIWLLVPGQQPAAEAFHRFAAAIVEARTAVFVSEVAVQGQPKRTFQTYYLAPGKFRQELDGVVNIMDAKAGRIINLSPTNKTATVLNMTGAKKQQGPLDLFEQMRELLADQLDATEQEYERLGVKEIAGRRAVGFRLYSPSITLTLWGDPTTGQPVLIENLFSGIPRTESTMKDFRFNVDLKLSLFDVTPPADYKIISVDVDASPPSETDLIGALRTTSDMAGGRFPDALDTVSVMTIVIKYVKQIDEESPEAQQKMMMEKSVAIGRGFGFALQLPESANAHYAGKGVKRGAKDRPIFWYKPETEQAYQVIFADLSTAEVEQAPKLAGAVRIFRDRASADSKPENE